MKKSSFRILKIAGAFCIAVFVFALAALASAPFFTTETDETDKGFSRFAAETATAKPSSAIPTDAASCDTHPVLVLMYHQFLNSRKSKYIVAPATFRNDLLALKAHGYRSVKAADLIDFADGKAELPEKPVVITFDDGHFSNHYYATPILKAEGFTAVESIIGRFSQNSVDTGSTGNPNYSHLSWDEIAEMVRSGVYEIGNHTYDMHAFKPRFGIGQKSGESDDAYRAALEKDALKLQNTLTERSGVTPYSFAFPFGKYNELAKQTLYRMGFRVMFTCNEHVSVIERGKPESLWSIGRYNRDPGFDINAFLNARDKSFGSSDS